jgi:hypothetical protein
VHNIAENVSEDDNGARRFISVLCPQGNLAIAEITTDGVVTGETFRLPEEMDGLIRRVSDRRGRANQYFTLNEPCPRGEQTGKNGRVAEGDIRKIRGIVIDIDPAKDAPFAAERERLLERAAQMKDGQHGAPTAVVDSGGGIQALYLFKAPLDATPDNAATVKKVAKALAQKLGGDATHSLDHLFRLPFTENLPDDRKRNRGREPAKARLIWCSVKDRRHTLLSLCAFAPPSPEPTLSPAARVVIDGREIAFVLGAPENLDDDLAARLERAKAERPALAKRLESECADRSERDFAIACACIEAGFTDPTELACIVAAHSEKAAERGDGAVGYLQNTVGKALAKTTPRRAEDYLENLESGAGDAAGASEEPLDIFEHDDPAELSAIPDSALPPTIRRWARSESRRKGTSMMFAAVSALAVVAAAVGNSLRIQPRRFDHKWTVPAALWVVLVASPGRGKSPIINAALEPLRALDRKLGEADEAKHAQWLALPKPKKGEPDTRGSEPAVRRRVVDDTTIEKLVRILRDNPRGVMRSTDELSSLLGSLGAYKKNADADRGNILGMFDGRPITIDRVGAGTIRADCALVTFLVGTQPDKIRALTSELGADGFLQRLLPVVDDGAPRIGIDEAPDEAAASDYEAAVRYLATAEHGRNAVVRLSPGGYEILREASASFKTLQHLPGASEAWASHVEKWDALLPRLVLIFHALAQWELFGSVDTAGNVADDTVKQAVRFARVLIRHSMAFYARFYGQRPEASEARKLAGYILAKPDKLSYTRREIGDAQKTLRDPRLLFETMRELEFANWCDVGARRADGPSSWRVNPKVHERFASHAEREKRERAAIRAAIVRAGEVRAALSDNDGEF